jgi:nicotinate-nucleotide pyrophosphorylase
LIILGYLFDSEEFYFIDEFSDVVSTSANSIIVSKFCEDRVAFYKSLKSNSVNFALEVSSLLDAVLANLVGAKYIIVDNKISKIVQNSADNYMFDSRVLVKISTKSEIEKHIIEQIDGVIFEDYLYKNLKN